LISKVFSYALGPDGGSLGPYPERLEIDPNWLDGALSASYGRLAPRFAGMRKWRAQIIREVEAATREVSAMSDRRLRETAGMLRGQLMREGFVARATARAFALVQEAAARRVGLRHYPVQLMGGVALLHGKLVEMETGEGKTLTATLPAATAALAGMPVHIITVNDYLAERDAELMRPVYKALGLSVGLVRHGQNPVERRDAYACDVTYCTNKELTFDYLRDRIALGNRRSTVSVQLESLFGLGDRGGRLLLRGLHFGIIDEADSVLIDEARTPLIISGEGDETEGVDLYGRALELVRRLEHRRDFDIAAGERTVRLSPAGRQRLDHLAAGLTGPWRARRGREELAENALSALHLHQRDQHYVVADGKVQIVDEFTGRVMPDRSWERGLHQMIETKEGCEPTASRSTLARITYQRFFRRYLRLAGMTATATEAAGEMWAVYGLGVVRMPTHRPLRRTSLGTRVFRNAEEKWRAVVTVVAEKSRAAGRPVLIGTRSVAASEHLSALFRASGLDHVVLNARQDRDEAEIVAAAGQAGRVTVATNMAGRGTDIRLAPGIAARGGLHVVLTEFHEAARIDRQLFGRAGRRGDPGSYEAIVALDDELFARFVGGLAGALSAFATPRGVVSRPLGAALRRLAQGSAERQNSRIRKATVTLDKKLDKSLAFTGRRE
jgi:preprotein translocase subunit SecA